MGNKICKPTPDPQPENKQPKEISSKALKDEIKTTIAYYINDPEKEEEIRDLINNPHKILPKNDPRRDEVKEALKAPVAFVGGVGLGIGVGIGHGIRASKIVGKGMIKLFTTAHTTGPAITVAIWSLGVVNLLAAGAQIYKMVQLYNKLNENYKEIKEIRSLLNKSTKKIKELLTNCTEKNYQKINLDDIDNLIEEVEETCERITLIIDEIRLKRSVLKKMSVGGCILAGLSLIAAGVCFFTGVGSIVAVGFLFGAAVICGVTSGGVLAYDHFYFARQVEKQVEEFQSLKLELIKVAAVLNIIRDSVRLQKFEENDFREYFKKKGMGKWEDCDTILDKIKKLLHVDTMLDKTVENNIRDVLTKNEILSSRINVVCKYVRQYQKEVEKAKEAIKKLTPKDKSTNKEN